MAKRDYYDSVDYMHRIYDGLEQLRDDKEFVVKFIFGLSSLAKKGARVYFDTIDKESAEVLCLLF